MGVGFGVVTIPYLWVLSDLWSGKIDPFRQLVDSNFYDVQARALFGGHLSIPNGSISFEAFVHGGRQYTYFGLFPSILRSPILVVTHSLDGKLTGASMLLAWLVTGVACSLLLWRVRVMLRGDSAPLGSIEAGMYGVLVAAMTAGSVLLVLAATPQVFGEELAWSVALALSCLFALLGILEAPTRARVIASAALILCTALNRGSTGYACILAALLIAAWFATGRMGTDERRWAVPVLLAGLIPALVVVAINLLKYGQPLGFSEAQQIWTQIDGHRRVFLAANGNDPFGLQFLPTTLTAYLRPNGLTFSTIFPYLSLPASHAPIVGHVQFDETDPTLSIPSSMPMVGLLAVWGVVVTFRPRSPGRIHLARIPLIAAASSALAVLLFGFVANRYLGDFLPFLAFASMIGAVDAWRRLAERSRRIQVAVSLPLILLAVFGVFANLAVAIGPSATWNSAQAHSFVTTQVRLNGAGVASRLVHSATVPTSAPAGTLIDVGRCNGLYLSTGPQESDQSRWRIQHSSWVAVEQASTINRTFTVKFNRPVNAEDSPIVLMTYGKSTLKMIPMGRDQVRLVLVPGVKPYPLTPPVIGPLQVRPDATYQFQVEADPNLDVEAASGLGAALGPMTAGRGSIHLATTSPSGRGVTQPLVSVRETTSHSDPTKLCEQLVRASGG